MAMKKKPKCINPNCKRLQHTRGLCSGCYASFHHLVKKGDVTEQEMMDAGKILPKFIKRKEGKFNWFLEGKNDEL